MTSRDAERGSMAVEFALVFPLVCLALSALLQTGLAVRSRIMVTQAAREGARQATTTNSDAEIRRAAAMAAGGLGGDGFSVAYSAPEGWRPGHPVTVSVTHNVPCVFPGLASAWPDLLRISESATMRLEKDLS